MGLWTGELVGGAERACAECGLERGGRESKEQEQEQQGGELTW